MKGFKLSLAAAVLLFSFDAGAVSLAMKWQTEKVFSTPESVIHDEINYILYVSNIGGDPTEKDGNGFISKLSVKGEVEALKWIKGLNAPKGMGIYDGKLYVADIDELVEIDIDRGRIIARHEVKGAAFLNDIAVDDKGNVYISDSKRFNDAIYRFSGGKVEKWLVDRKIHRPNGLFFDGKRLVVGVSGDSRLRAVDLSTKEITEVASVGSSIDGVAGDSKGNFIVSDWKGKTVFIEKGGGIIVLLDTTGEKINSADICFIEKWKMLCIPTFFDNRVVCTTLKY